MAATYQALGQVSDAKPLYERVAVSEEMVRTAGERGKTVENDRLTPPGETRAFSRLDEPTPYWQVVPVFYGTDRQSEPSGRGVEYGSDRGRKLDLGRALVTVPKTHEVPKIERPWTLAIPYFNLVIYSKSEDPKEHFTLQEVKALPKSEFLSLVRQRLENSSNFKNEALVFIHGFNTEFDAALFRTAQIAYDLGFDGAPFLYSWPSGGSVASYTYDRESAGQSQSYLREFLNMVVTETGATSVSIIAHSMGNQPLLEVLKDINAAKPNSVAFNQIILAAPDVDADNFKYLTQSIEGVAKGITLYAASNDRALIVSRNFWRNPRAGDVVGNKPLVMQGVDTIDVSATSLDIVGLHHSEYAQSKVLLDDIGQLIKTGQRPPTSRTPGLQCITIEGDKEYWRYP